MQVVEREKSSSFEVTQEIEISSSRAVTTRKYENYYIISTFEAAISRGHKHGCLVKLIDSFLVITASCNASLKKALVRTKFSPFWQKFESFSDSGRVFSAIFSFGWGLSRVFCSNSLQFCGQVLE